MLLWDPMGSITDAVLGAILSCPKPYCVTNVRLWPQNNSSHKTQLVPNSFSQRMISVVTRTPLPTRWVLMQGPRRGKPQTQKKEMPSPTKSTPHPQSKALCVAVWVVVAKTKHRETRGTTRKTRTPKHTNTATKEKEKSPYLVGEDKRMKPEGPQ